MEKYCAGDVIELLLDTDQGSLRARKNGVALGLVADHGVTGEGLCWAVALGGTCGSQVSLSFHPSALFRLNED